MPMIRVQRGVLLAALIAVFLPALTAAAQNDVLCAASKKRYAQPANCAEECKGQIDAVRCQLEPNLKALDDGFFKTYYNSSVFFGVNLKKVLTCSNKGVDESIGTTGGMQVMPGGMGMIPFAAAGAARPDGLGPRDLLVARIFGLALLPNQYKKFHISWGTQAADPNAGMRHQAIPTIGEWADVSKDRKTGMYNLTINPLVLCMSPAAMVETMGHEMTHVEQQDRQSSDNEFLGYRSVVNDLREVEAYSWELGQGNFKWRIGPNRFRQGLSAEEKMEAPLMKACYERDTVASIVKIKQQPFSKVYLDAIGKYMTEDAWVSSNWLPSHKNWRDATTVPPLSTECKGAGFD